MKNAIKILLVEDDQETCCVYRKLLECSEKMHLVCTTDSEQKAYDFVTQQEVDAIILDLEIQEGDGLSFMYRLKEYYSGVSVKPLVMVVTNNASHVTWAMAKENGADYVIPKLHVEYSPVAVLSKLEKAYIYYRKGMTDENAKKIRQSSALMRGHIEDYLESIGVKGTYNEKKYVVESVLLAMKWNGSEFAQLSKEVYPTVARKFHVSRFSVEKYIRLLLKRNWDTLDEEFKQKLCPHASKRRRRRATNTEFIGNIAKYLKG